MSKALEALELERITAVQEELTATKYNDLKAVLTAKGLGEAWSAGEKKEIIITKAIQLLSKVTEETPEVKKEEIKPEVPAVEKEPVKQAEIEPEITEVKAEQVKEVIEPVKESVVVEEKVENKEPLKEDDPRNFVSKLTSNISLDDLEKNLERITVLMAGAPDFQKMIYLQKRKQIEEKIKELTSK